MSAYYFVRGIMDPTDDYKKKYAAFKACKEAGIEIPQQLWDYFNNDTPYEDGISMKIPFEKKEEVGCSTYEVDLKKIPPQVTKVQFLVCW